MSCERPAHRPLPTPHEVFGLTEQEHLHRWVNHGRFQGILNDDQTTIHRVGESSTDLGDFLSVTVSRPADLHHHSLRDSPTPGPQVELWSLQSPVGEGPHRRRARKQRTGQRSKDRPDREEVATSRGI